jgi:hypothetical protein
MEGSEGSEMSLKLDPDLKVKTAAQLRQEVMRWRHAARQEACSVGNGRCWTRLVANLPENVRLKPLALPKLIFLGNCERYFDRNQPKQRIRRPR